jgi:adenosylcobinamide-phosphate synthase
MRVLWFDGRLILMPLAAIADFLIGDPWHWIHPVQVMGWIIQYYQTWVFQQVKTQTGQRLAGIVLGLLLPLGCGAIAASLVQLGQILHPVVGGAIAVIIVASCLAGRSLRRAAEEVLQPLTQRDFSLARKRLSQYVGRDTDILSAPEIYRAVMETLSENATDGVLAPLFYGLVGVTHSLAAAAGLAIAYKAISTLDSMVGYRRAPYTYLGWFSARLEDGATWLPCRLVVLTIGLLSGRPNQVWQICRRDAPADPSPNAGWSECVYAAALGIQLGGTNIYQGEVHHKPLLGNAERVIDAIVIQQGLQLTRRACLLWIAFSTVGLAGGHLGIL